MQKITANKLPKNISDPDSLNKITVTAEIHSKPITLITQKKLTENKLQPLKKFSKSTKQIPDPPIELQTNIPTPPLQTSSKLTL